MDSIRTLLEKIEEGDSYAQYELAQCYEDRRDYESSLYWYEKAAHWRKEYEKAFS